MHSQTLYHAALLGMLGGASGWLLNSVRVVAAAQS